MNGLDRVKKAGKEESLNIIRESGLTDYGYYAGKQLADIWMEADLESDEIQRKKRISASLNNCDYEEILLSIVENNPSDVLEGMAIAAQILGTEHALVYLPDGKIEIANRIKELSSVYGLSVDISYEMPDTKIVKSELFYDVNAHFETYASLKRLFADPDTFESSIYLAVRQDKEIGRLKEYPMGVSVKDVLGETVDENVKAIEIGSRLFLPEAAYDLKLDSCFQPEDGVISVIKSEVCLVDRTLKKMEAFCYKSCGKCTFCREGSRQFHAIFKDITEGKASTSDLALVKEIAGAMELGTQCSVGWTGANPVSGVLDYFIEEVEDHIKRKKCPTETCKAFMNIYIDPAKCQGCGDCAEVCPVDCIEGEDGYIYMIDDLECTKCGKCIEACSYEAVIRATGRLPKLPEKLTKVGKFKKR